MLGIVSGAISALLLVLFIAGWIWAWSSKRSATFDEAARLPLHEDAGGTEHGDAARARARAAHTNRSGSRS